MDRRSSDHSMIEQSLNDFNRFIKSGSRGQESQASWSKQATTPIMQLSFSEADEDETQQMVSCKRKSQEHANDFVKKHRNSVVGLDICRILEDKESELVVNRAMLTSLRGQISAAKTTNQKIKLDYDSELSQLRLDHLHKEELISELQLKLKHEKQSADILRTEKSQIKEESSDLKYSLQSKLSSSTIESSCLSNKLKERVTELEKKLSNSEHKLAMNTSELGLCETELKSVREDLNAKVKKIQELYTQLLEVETLKIELGRANTNNKELQGRLDQLSAQEELTVKFEESIRKLPDLERKCAKLQDMNDMYKACSANTRLLEEQVASASDEISLLKERNSNTAQIQADLDYAKSQLSQLTSVIVSELSLSAAPQPDELKTLLRSLRSEDKALTDSIAAMRESVSSHEKQSVSLETETVSLREVTAQKTLLSQRHVQLARRLQRKLLLVSKERDSLKAILTSYESETTMTATAVTSSARMSRLEEDLNLYKQEIVKLEEELDDYQHAPKLHGEENRLNKADKEELKKLSQKIEDLNTTVSKLEEEKEVLEYRLEQRAIRGDFDPSAVKVVHLAENPTTWASSHYKDEVSKLVAEIKTVREQLVKAQQGNNSSSLESLNVESSDKDKKKIEDLVNEKKSMEIKYMRLIEAFKKKSKEMHEIVYRLLGYKLSPNGSESNSYRLDSMYAESPDHYFVFKYTDAGEIQLLATEFSNSLEEFIDDYLVPNGAAYPAFLSAITMDLYNKQTVLVPSTSVARLSSPAVESRREIESDEEEEESYRKRKMRQIDPTAEDELFRLASGRKETKAESDERRIRSEEAAGERSVLRDLQADDSDDDDDDDDDDSDDDRVVCEDVEMNSDSEEEEMRRVRHETDMRGDSEDERSDSEEEEDNVKKRDDNDSESEKEDGEEHEYYEEEEDEEEDDYEERRPLQPPPPLEDDDSDDDLICLD